MTSFHALCPIVTACHLLLETPASTISRLNLLSFFPCARVGCATDDDFVPFASSNLSIKTLEELPHCLVALLRAPFCDAVIVCG